MFRLRLDNYYRGDIRRFTLKAEKCPNQKINDVINELGAKK